MNTIWFRWHAEFTGSAQRAADKHFCVSKITGVGGKQAASDGTLPWFSLSPPTAGRHGGKGRERGEGKGRGEGGGSIKEERERESVRLDKMNYAKLSEAAIVGGPGCVKGIQR